MPKIGTHNGTFHCDEALACFMLLHTEEFKGSEITRTRDEQVLAQMDVLVDVGSVYDPSRHRYDHHQPSFHGTFDDKHSTRLSSAGLVYKHFGRQIIKRLLGVNDKETEIIYQRVYDELIESLDAIDNGVNQYDGPAKYKIATDLSARVSRLNPWWNDPNPNADAGFQKAIQIVGEEFLTFVNFYGKSWLPARSIVEEAISQRFQIDESGSIVVLEQFCPWKDHLFQIESENGIQGSIKYCLFQDSSKSWRVQCVPVHEDSFNNRLSLLWKGLRDDDLSKASEIPGGIFVHVSGFIGGNKTKEGALAMARKSLQQPQQ